MTNEPTTIAVEPRAARRRAFTLVELIVVVAIIGILVALLLPAVQAAREAARRTSCSNNLVQLVMAIHNYESTHQVYPPGTVNPTGPIANQLKGYHHGWIEQMLPYVEAEAIYHHIDRDVSVYHKNNRPVRRLELSWLKCASNPQSGQGFSNYAALHHDVEAAIDADQNGVFYLNSAVTKDAVSDGIGYTIFLGEKVTEADDLGWLSGTRAILRNTGERINTATDQANRPRPWGAASQFPAGVERRSASMGSPYGGGMSASSMEDADSMDYGGFDDEEGGLFDEDEFGDLSDGLGVTSPRQVAPFVGGFASYHPGGANFAMGDGSVRLLAKTMSMSVYRQMGHRADGELVNLE